MARNSVILILLLIGTSLWAADRDVSIASVVDGPGKPWQWTIFIKGAPDALAHIKCVQYVLDPSFPNRSRTVCDRGTEDRPFPSTGTTWSPFKLSATVTFDDGNVQQFQYILNPQEGNAIPSSIENAPRNTGVYHRNGWRPIDLTFNPTSGLLVLDDDGKVSKVISDVKGVHLETLPLDIPRSSRPTAVAASKDSVFVSANNSLGCTVFRYSFASNKTSEKLLENADVGHDGCDGIATDGVGMFLVVPGRREIRYWSDFNASSYKSWNSPVPTPDTASGYLNFTDACTCLIFAGTSGTAYTLSPQQGKWLTVTYNLGYVHSITSDSSRILFASGKSVLFYSTTNNRRENVPSSMKSLTGGLISGVAIDSAGSAWIAVFDEGIIKGPIPLS
jgi:YEATS family